jgi:hypothetical protein
MIREDELALARKVGRAPWSTFHRSVAIPSRGEWETNSCEALSRAVPTTELLWLLACELILAQTSRPVLILYGRPVSWFLCRALSLGGSNQPETQPEGDSDLNS